MKCGRGAIKQEVGEMEVKMEKWAQEQFQVFLGGRVTVSCPVVADGSEDTMMFPLAQREAASTAQREAEGSMRTGHSGGQASNLRSHLGTAAQREEPSSSQREAAMQSVSR